MLTLLVNIRASAKFCAAITRNVANTSFATHRRLNIFFFTFAITRFSRTQKWNLVEPRISISLNPAPLPFPHSHAINSTFHRNRPYFPPPSENLKHWSKSFHHTTILPHLATLLRLRPTPIIPDERKRFSFTFVCATIAHAKVKYSTTLAWSYPITPAYPSRTLATFIFLVLTIVLHAKYKLPTHHTYPSPTPQFTYTSQPSHRNLPTSTN